MNAKNVIIAGSTGMIGKLVLNACLQSNDVEKITCIVRRNSGNTHPKLREIIHTNYLDYTGLEQCFTSQDVCLYCIGVYTGQVSPDEFRKITVDYTTAFAGMLKRNSPDCNFCFLSGQGAHSTEKSRILFAREKGIAENYLLKLHFKETHIFRPGYIYPVVPRKEPNFGYKLMRMLYKPVAAIYPNIGVTSVKLADKMVDVGLYGSDKIIYENRDIMS